MHHHSSSRRFAVSNFTPSPFKRWAACLTKAPLCLILIRRVSPSKPIRSRVGPLSLSTGLTYLFLAARAFIRARPADLLANEAAYPPREVLERCELIQEIGTAISLYDRYWTEIKSK